MSHGPCPLPSGGQYNVIVHLEQGTRFGENHLPEEGVFLIIIIFQMRWEETTG
jgi:hypothetical protein